MALTSRAAKFPALLQSKVQLTIIEKSRKLSASLGGPTVATTWTALTVLTLNGSDVFGKSETLLLLLLEIISRL